MMGVRFMFSYYGRDVGNTPRSSAGNLNMHLLSINDHYQQLSDS